MTTIRDVAGRAQVSIATVSRVINDHPSVNPAIRRVVQQVIEELHFQPSAIARTLRTAKTRTIGLLVSSTRNADLMSSAIRGAEAAAHEHGYALFVANSRRDPRIEARYLRNMLERRVDGLLLNPTMPLEEMHALVQRAGAPAVIVGQPAPNGLLPATVLNFAAASEEAIDHLVELGHRRIGSLTDTSQSGLDVNVGFGVRFLRHAFRARGVEVNRQYHPVAQSTADCTRLVRNLFTGSRPPTALFVTPLYLIPATIAGIRAAGARVPRDVSLIGFGDSEWVQVVEPPLSVVAADITAHFDAATRRLIGLIERGSDDFPETEHRARYIRRGSVQRPRGHTGRAAGAVGHGDHDAPAAK